MRDVIISKWYLVYQGSLHEDGHPYSSRDDALKAVSARNQETPGFTCVRVPSSITACEGCEDDTLDAIYRVGASHLTRIEWRTCRDHEYWGQNEQTSLIASWVYED